VLVSRDLAATGPAAAAAAGGTVIYAACFASQTSSHDMDAVFKAMGLSWSHGSYYRLD
jgi:hypothetical protein